MVAPVEVGGKRNAVSLEKRGGGFWFGGDLGAAWLEGGAKKGDEVYHPLLDVALHVAGKTGRSLDGLKATLSWAGAPRGTANSASISVALALALFKHFGKNPGQSELYDAGFVGDNAYHGGKSSGGDVAAVVSDKAKKFRRVFKDGAVVPESLDVELHMPRGTQLVLASTQKEGQERSSTAALIEQFAKAHGVSKKPAEMSDAERHALFDAFDVVVEKIASLCGRDASPEALGAALDENHSLLESVSTPAIDQTLSVAKQAGALGGKLIGAGGAGSALIVLVPDEKLKTVQSAVSDLGFESWPVGLAKRGPALD